MAFSKFCFANLKNCRINLVMPLASATSRLHMGKKRRQREKTRLLEETAEMSSTVQITEM